MPHDEPANDSLLQGRRKQPGSDRNTVHRPEFIPLLRHTDQNYSPETCDRESKQKHFAENRRVSSTTKGALPRTQNGARSPRRRNGAVQADRYQQFDSKRDRRLPHAHQFGAGRRNRTERRGCGRLHGRRIQEKSVNTKRQRPLGHRIRRRQTVHLLYLPQNGKNLPILRSHIQTSWLREVVDEPKILTSSKHPQFLRVGVRTFWKTRSQIRKFQGMKILVIPELILIWGLQRYGSTRLKTTWLYL